MSTHPAIPPEFSRHAGEMLAVAKQVEGHLTDREVRFLALLGAVPTCTGDVLEIGSFKGKSTVVLAKSAVFAGESRICAVDPLDLPAATDPTEITATALAGVFYGNLRERGVTEHVEFHPKRSEELAREWRRPLRLLWIDGDHTWSGARNDVEAFAGFLAPGGIIAFHDVLHRYEGPVRALAELVLSSPKYGACGVVGSIGWAQYLGDEKLAAPFAAGRDRLRRRLASLIAHAALGAPSSLADKLLYKIRRARVPHAEQSPHEWAGRVLRLP